MRTIDEEVVMTKDKLADLYELIEDAVKRNGQVLFDDHLQRLDYLQLKLIGKGDYGLPICIGRMKTITYIIQCLKKENLAGQMVGM